MDLDCQGGLVFEIHAKIITRKKRIKFVNVAALTIIVIMSFAAIVPQAFAHTTVEVEPYEIEVGWGLEPPIVGIRNDFVFRITEPVEAGGSYIGIKNAFKDLEATAVFGGTSKGIDINSDARLGYYYSPVIPTKIGSYAIDLKGQIDGVEIVIQIPIEDVESTAILDFPPASGSSSDQDVMALKNAIASIQRDMSGIKSGDRMDVSDGGAAYDFAVLGLSISSAAIVLAVIVLVKRK